MAELFKAHLNPGQYHFMKLLGFHKVKVESAEGMFYTDQNGRKILDFFGGPDGSIPGNTLHTITTFDVVIDAAAPSGVTAKTLPG